MSEVQSCPEVSRLQRLLDGLLTDEEQAALNEHLADCSTCQERLDGLIAGQGMWSDVARNLKSAHAEIEAGTATRYAARPGEALDHADDDLTLEFLDHSDKPDSLGRLGHYEVLEVIGRGGMGIVLRAFDEKLHRVVAIKVMAPRLAATSPPRKRFLREARAAAKVRHENVIDIHAVEEQPIPHLVMEFVPGESLQQRLDRIGPLEVPDLLRIGQQIARGLAAAHAQGLIHRDVKPGNVLLEKGIEERVKITDFGLARAADDASMTQSGVIAGTPLYMAPEQAQGGAIDHRADLFSFGTVLYTMASGRPPFRAPTSLAVLKRVVEDAPRPIQEIIPEVPQWLCDIIAKLHAKRPEDRFQSAKEVADLLGQCQKEYAQHGQVKPLSKPVAPAPPPPKPHVAARATQPPATGLGIWVIAASLLLLLMCVLSLSEATGVTHVAATVIRLFTPEGTLVVESTDPDVKVTIEGDGGLVITGAGPQEVRVRPGSYKVQAVKDGKPVSLDRDLVSITKGDRQIVRVRVEGIARGPAPVVRSAEKGAFVVLGGKGVAERKFDTLAEAVTGASDGDTIEVRGNGPFVTKPIVIDQKSLTLRAGAGFWPVIKADPDESSLALINTNAALVVEGLDLQWVNVPALDEAQVDWKHLLVCNTSTGRLQVANCRFLMNRRAGLNGGMNCIQTSGGASCQVRNCQFAAYGAGVVDFGCSSQAELLVDNCLMVGSYLYLPLMDAGSTKVVLKRNAFVGFAQFVCVVLNKEFDPAVERKIAPSLQIQASANVIDGIMEVRQIDGAAAAEKPLDTEKLLTRLVTWREDGNLYLLPKETDLLWLKQSPGKQVPSAVPTKTMADWKGFWGMDDLDSKRGNAKFQGGDLVAKANLTPELLAPEDFRLRTDSDGYRAGKDGKDLGADVDLVGPGPAYERWKQTPDYQEWLKDTGQVLTTAPATPQPEAAKRELAKWQGEWENELGDKLTIKGDQWSWWSWSAANAKSEQLTMHPLKIVEVRDKMTHVLLLSKGIDGKVLTCQAIFHLDGDTLHYCGTYKDGPPPEFATSPGYQYHAWKRPAKEDKAAAAKELEKLQGKWSRVSFEADGKQLKGEDPDHIFTFKGINWSIHVGGQLLQAGTVERIDVKEKHAVLYFLDTKAGTWGVAIFVIEGDTLKYLNSQDNRVTEFTTAPGDGRNYGLFRRVKP